MRSSRSAAGSERKRFDLAEQMSHFGHVAAIGDLSRQRRSRGVTDKHAGVAERQIEGIEPALATGRGGHFAQRQMGNVGRGDLLDRSTDRPRDRRGGVKRVLPTTSRSCSAVPFSDGNEAGDRVAPVEFRRCRCRRCASRFQNSSRLSAPGNRQAMPMIARGGFSLGLDVMLAQSCKTSVEPGSSGRKGGHNIRAGRRSAEDSTSHRLRQRPLRYKSPRQP